jgi:hypothetical protein
MRTPLAVRRLKLDRAAPHGPWLATCHWEER